jgi:F-type H+-transporting ATPase subunit a
MNGVGGVLVHIFGPKGKSSGVLKVLLLVIFFLVGVLEVVSILFRPISLSFRLYGNVYAGEVMLESMAAVAPKFLTWLIPIPFYFLELLVGFVQALVFMLLTASSPADRATRSRARTPLEISAVRRCTRRGC